MASPVYKQPIHQQQTNMNRWAKLLGELQQLAPEMPPELVTHSALLLAPHLKPVEAMHVEEQPAPGPEPEKKKRRGLKS